MSRPHRLQPSFANYLAVREDVLVRRRPSSCGQCARCPGSARRRVPVCLLDDTVAVVLSHFEAAALLSLRKTAQELGDASPAAVVHGDWSINLGRSRLPSLTVTREGIVFPDAACAPLALPTTRTLAPVLTPVTGAHVTFDELRKMAKKGRVGAYEVYRDGATAPDRIAGMSVETSRAASLQPHVAHAPPTVALGGFCMHRFKGTDPAADTAAKLAALAAAGAVSGRALDVCTGLGYTAIALAQHVSVSAVITVELDPFIASDISARNPWSEDLFRNPKIERIIGDATFVLPTLSDASFDVIIHDPPAQAMGGELYSLDFYKQLARVLVPGGRLFHYIGDPSSVESGRLFRGVGQRLEAAGFESVRSAEDAFGLIARRSF